MSAALGSGYALVTGGRPHEGAVAGGLIGLLITSFELFFVQAPAGAWLRRLPFLAFTCLSTLAWGVLVAFALLLATPVVLGIELYPSGTPRLAIARDMAFAFAVGSNSIESRCFSMTSFLFSMLAAALAAAMAFAM